MRGCSFIAVTVLNLEFLALARHIDFDFVVARAGVSTGREAQNILMSEIVHYGIARRHDIAGIVDRMVAAAGRPADMSHGDGE